MNTWGGMGLRWLVFACLLTALGCAPKGRAIKPVPQIHSGSAPSTQAAATLGPALQAARVGRWFYERRESQHESSRKHPYPRFVGSRRFSEGLLAYRRFLPLNRYLRAAPTSTAPSDGRVPQAPLKGGTAILFELAEPLEPIPADLTPGAVRTDTTAVTYYDYDGKQLARGTITRTVEFEGVETVRCPAGEFPDCPRVRVELALRIPWLISMDWSSWLWLSPRAGEVKRLEHMNGLFWIFLFSSTHEYVLASHEPAPKRLLETVAQDSTPKWKTGAVLLSRAIPRPEIAGMVIDYASSPTSAPAGSQPAAR